MYRLKLCPGQMFQGFMDNVTAAPIHQEMALERHISNASCFMCFSLQLSPLRNQASLSPSTTAAMSLSKSWSTLLLTTRIFHKQP